jgi:hypothetical protein
LQNRKATNRELENKAINLVTLKSAKNDWKLFQIIYAIRKG